MNDKQKHEIRQQVVLGILNFIFYIFLVGVGLALICLPFAIMYDFGTDVGFEEGFQAANDNIHKLFEEFDTVWIINSDGEELQLEEYHFCSQGLLTAGAFGGMAFSP